MEDGGKGAWALSGFKKPTSYSNGRLRSKNNLFQLDAFTRMGGKCCRIQRRFFGRQGEQSLEYFPGALTESLGTARCDLRGIGRIEALGVELHDGPSAQGSEHLAGGRAVQLARRCPIEFSLFGSPSFLAEPAVEPLVGSLAAEEVVIVWQRGGK